MSPRHATSISKPAANIAPIGSFAADVSSTRLVKSTSIPYWELTRPIHVLISITGPTTPTEFGSSTLPFFVIAYDGIGSKIVSKLLADDDRVYFWEPHVEPHFFLIADNLEEFYQGLSKAPFCFENTSLFQKLPRFIKRFFH